MYKNGNIVVLKKNQDILKYITKTIITTFEYTYWYCKL